MIDLDFIERLIKAVDESGLDSLEIERGGTKVRLAKTPPAGVARVDFAPAGAAAPPPVSAPGEAAPVAEVAAAP
jgi:acetyl-CoA carboxylase biotin carboxyl carrier protein